MAITGRCYCGNITYSVDAEPLMRGQCHCRECQYISGGHANVIMGFPADRFVYTSGEVKVHRRDQDVSMIAHREFCPNCGTHILTRPEGMNMVVIKVGTLDDPSLFGQAEFALQMADSQSFHTVPEGIPTYDRWMD